MGGYARVTIRRVHDSGSVSVESYQCEPADGNDVEIVGFTLGCVVGDVLGMKILAKAVSVHAEGAGPYADDGVEAAALNFIKAAESFLEAQ